MQDARDTASSKVGDVEGANVNGPYCVGWNELNTYISR